MKIYEYQAKKLFLEYGILVPAGELALTPIAAELATLRLGAPVMIKAQIQAGGRGKGGGIKIASKPCEAKNIASQILGKKLVTPQTPAEGILVNKILVEKKLKPKPDSPEFYLAITIDREKECPIIIASATGGMDIEELAKDHPEKIVEELIDETTGFKAFQGRWISFRLGVDNSVFSDFAKILAGLYKLFKEKDCILVEINPLVLCEDLKFYALDAKMIFDDNALFRHPELKKLCDDSIEDPLEAEAIKCGINYVKLGGNIGCLVNGAGLAMATMDRIFQLGAKPANFLDIGGGARPEQAEMAFRILFDDPNVKVILVNIFSGVFRVEAFAEGLKKAREGKDIQIPLVIRIEGDNAESRCTELRESGIEFYLAGDMEEGIKKAIELSREVENDIS